MRQRNLLLIVIAILGLLAVMGLQGCGLFGGGGGDEEAAGTEGAEGMPEEGMPPDEGMGGPPPGEMGGAPPEGAPGEEAGMPPMDEEPGEGPAPATGGADAGALVAEGMATKHQGNYVTARQKFEAAVAASPDNADAHWGLAWIYAEMADAGDASMKAKAIEEFQTFLQLGGTQEQVAEAEAALERLQ